MEFLSLADYRKEAAARLSSTILAFIEGGAGEEHTLRANADAFDRLRLLPKVLVDVSTRSLSTTVLGEQIALPVLIAPSAMHGMVHDHAEEATVQAAGNMGTVMILSLASSLPVERVLARASGPVWFQAYVGQDRRRTAEVIARAENAGCRALVVTVDAPVVGGRSSELRSGFEVSSDWFADDHQPMYGLTAPVASGRGSTELWDASLNWDDLEWLRSVTGMPLILKGILRSDDAARAATAGVNAIIVSNHGGRQLDHTLPTLDALPPIVEAVHDDVEILLDGGIRRGSDVFKAIALGARAVLVGRPVLWGLAVDGQRGVEAVISTLAEQLDLTMALCGARSVDEIAFDLVGFDRRPG